MKITKTWFNYVIWGIFFVIMFVAVGVAANGLVQEQTGIQYYAGIGLAYLIVIVGVFIIQGASQLVAKLYRKLEEKLPDFSKAYMPVWLEVSLLVLTMLMNIAVRAVIVVSANSTIMGTDTYYKYATEQIGLAEFGKWNNGAFVYCNLVRFMNSVLGVKEYSAMCLQLIIQLGIIVLSYIVVRKFFGKWQAWIATLCISFLPSSFVEIARVTPDMFLSFLVLVMIFFGLLLSEASSLQKYKNNACTLLYILYGVGIGYVMYLDPVGIVLLVISIIIFFNSKSEDPWLNIHKPWYQCLIFAITALVIFALLTANSSMNGLEHGFEALFGYGKVFTSSGLKLDLQILTPGYGYKDALLLITLAGLAVIGFFLKDEDNAYPFVFIVVCITLLRFFSVDTSEYSQLTNLLWAVIASFVIEGMISVGKKAVSEEEILNKQRKKEQKRLIKEAKNDRKENMKSISLAPQQTDEFSQKNLSKSISNTGKKGYGIGKTSSGNNVNAEKEYNTPKFSNDNEVKNLSKEVSVPVASVPVNTTVNAVKDNTIVKPSVTKSYGIGKPVGKPEVHKESVTETTLKSVNAEDKTEVRKEDLFTNTIVKEDRSTLSDMVQNEQKTSSNETNKEKNSLEMESKEKLAESSPLEVKNSNENITVTDNNVNMKEEDGLTNEIKKSSSGYSSSNATSNASNNNNLSIQNDYYSVLSSGSNQENSSQTLNQTSQQGSLIQPIENKEKRVNNNPIGTEHRVAMPSRRTLKPEYRRGISLNGVPVVPQTPAEQNVAPAPAPTTSVNSTLNESAKPNSSTSIANGIGSIPTSSSIAKPEVKQSAPTPMIKNPLPTPKQHVPKQMDYDYVPRNSEMKYDIEDLKGKDYYDI